MTDLLAGRREVTPRWAIDLGAAFGTSAELWLNLESSYRLFLAGRPDPAISERAERASRVA